MPLQVKFSITTTMALFTPTSFSLRRERFCCYSSLSASLGPECTLVSGNKSSALWFEESKERIKNLFNKVELSASSYDTAWVALVPSPDSSADPCFPQCINWLLDSQLNDGSWGLPNLHPSLIKDALSCTVASLLALKRWGVGEEHINKGLRFLELNISSATDDNLYSPIGFEIILPGMVEYARDLELNLPFGSVDFSALVHKRELELRRAHFEGRGSFLAYVSEGLGMSQDWEMVMKYQKKNGSLFHSPATTAAAYLHLQDDRCLNYLRSLLEKSGNSVPTVYPLDIHVHLYMVDCVESLGIERHFKQEIKNVLDETYRYWLQGKEELLLDAATCAMAFRILRLHGYDVSSDPLALLNEGKSDSLYPPGHSKDISAALELYRASQIMIGSDEALEKQHEWSRNLLKEKLSDGTFIKDGLDKHLYQQVNEALRFPFHAELERAGNRKYVEYYNADSTTILKTSFRSPNLRNGDFLKLAVEDFNKCQSMHREELKQLERWVVENKLDELKFARQKSVYAYYSAAATLFSPELYDARMTWAKNAVLTTVVDDFFDVGGSMEELENLIQLVKRWDVDLANDCCSEHVRIIFSALSSTISDIGAKAYTYQGRRVTTHIIDIWLDLLNSMLREAKWAVDKSVPAMDEYMSNAFVSFALGPIVLPTLYFVGPALPEEAVFSSEYSKLFMLMSTCGRLLNDVNGFERESKEGKLNAVSLHMIHNSECLSEEEAAAEFRSSIVNSRRELLRLVLQTDGSLVPRACKDVFWKMCKVVHTFYLKDDGFTSQEMMNPIKEIINEPIVR